MLEIRYLIIVKFSCTLEILCAQTKYVSDSPIHLQQLLAIHLRRSDDEATAAVIQSKTTGKYIYVSNLYKKNI